MNEKQIKEARTKNWQWQLRNRITTAEELQEHLPLSNQEMTDISTCLNTFRMAVTPYYLSLINPNDPQDPIKKQAVPRIDELTVGPYDMEDPLHEDIYSPVPNLIHRYNDRALLLTTFQCSMYCRHCTRRRVVGENDCVISQKKLDAAVKYITEHTEIRDVLISGGDPLTMSTKKLENIVSAIRSIPTVEIIRIGTRIPVVMPMRIDDELLTMLKKYQPIYINTHFNHPNEVTEQSAKACEAIVDAGFPLGNQTVLLRGVNDSSQVMKDLVLKLLKIRVRPYYIYQCDLSKGLSHFRTSVATGISIVHDLQGHISGLAVPRYVIDAPNGGGKIPISYEYIKEETDKYFELVNFEGKTFFYPKIEQ